MPPKKILILSILISLTSHVAMLSLTGFINMQGQTSLRPDVLTVQLKIPQEAFDKANEKKEKKKLAAKHEKERVEQPRSVKEDTVDLGDIDGRYTPYLKKIKEKIETIWTYPKNAYKNEEEGITVIKFTINKNGNLVSNKIVTSSGSIFLDRGTTDVIKSAAPYDPLPSEYDLSQLNIVASFHYKLFE